MQVEPFPLLITIHMPEKILATATIYDKKQSWVVKSTNPTVFMTIIEDKQKQKEDCEKKVQSTPAYIL